MFLLLVSVRVKKGLLNNALILIDEPSISLHPTGERFLRDELIKISEKNFVIYSTHSIFMIDGENIGRHLKIEKRKEITTISEINESNIMDEEVVYNALGYSIFENLKKRNIIFEGWRDKKLFQVAMSKVPAGHKNLKEVFDDLGLCHGKGVKHIQFITSMLELGCRQSLILSDNDEPAKRYQKEYMENEFFGIWKRYDEIYPECAATTGEDFIMNQVFVQATKELKEKYSDLPKISGSDLSDSRGKVYAISKWLNGLGYDTVKKKDALEDIKTYIFENLKPSHIESDYYLHLDKLAGFISDNMTE